MKRFAVAAAACAMLGGAFTEGVSPDRLHEVPVGDWGGEHVRLVVRDASASIEFDCAHGALDEPLRLDDQGRFDVPGSLVREGGPTRPESEDKERVRYVGKADRRRMGLEVVREGGERLGPFALKLGERPKLVKCR